MPTRKVSVRLTVTYAGFSGESDLLESLYKRAISGEQIAPYLYRGDGMLAFWTNDCCAPWQTSEWRNQMRVQLRPNAYLRLIENRWVTTESSFIDMAAWDACIDRQVRPVVSDPRLAVWVGVDASTKRDSTAIVACSYDVVEKRVRLVAHRIFQPSPNDPLDFEATVERTLLDLGRRFRLREIRFDPWQLIAVAQRLRAAGLPMVEFPQTVPNLTEASSNLYELVKGRNLVAYADDEIRLAISRSVALETSRGWRIAKEKQSHKIDVVVALAQAALGAATQAGAPGRTLVFSGLFSTLIYDSWALKSDTILAPMETTDLADNTGAGECAGCHALISTGSRTVKRGSRIVSVCGVCYARLADRPKDYLLPPI